MKNLFRRQARLDLGDRLPREIDRPHRHHVRTPAAKIRKRIRGRKPVQGSGAVPALRGQQEHLAAQQSALGRRPGTDSMILKIFSPKNSAKKLALLTQNKAKLCKILIITLVLD
jgi:hypothetical protein